MLDPKHSHARIIGNLSSRFDHFKKSRYEKLKVLWHKFLRTLKKYRHVKKQRTCSEVYFTPFDESTKFFLFEDSCQIYARLIGIFCTIACYVNTKYTGNSTTGGVEPLKI